MAVKKTKTKDEKSKKIYTISKDEMDKKEVVEDVAPNPDVETSDADNVGIDNKPDENVPIYSVQQNGVWLPTMFGLKNSETEHTNGYIGNFGTPITMLTIGNVGMYRVYTAKSGWSEYFGTFDKDNPAGDGTPILAIDIPNLLIDKIQIGIHVKGGEWVNGVHNKYAGCMIPFDGLWISK